MKHTASILLLLILSGCGAENPPGAQAKALPPYVEGEKRASPQEADRVTEKARAYFVEWLRGHHEEHIVNDDSGVGVACSPTRLWATLYGTTATKNGFMVETEFRITLPNGQQIVEFLAGTGDTEEAAIDQTFANFTLTTFHVVYSCFMNLDDPHVTHESIESNGRKWKIAVGDLMTVGDGDGDFSKITQQFRDAILKLDLPPTDHWFKLVYARDGDEAITGSSATYDNKEHSQLSDAIAAIDWPSTDKFYISKQFVVLQLDK